MGKDNNIFYCLSGLGEDTKSNEMIRLNLTDDTLEINKLKSKMFGKEEIIKTYKINAGDILKADIVTEEELKDKSVLGRGAAGALLLGPVGAVLGGMTALKNKKINKFFAISYLPSQGNKPQTIVFEAEPPLFKNYNKLYISKFKQKIATIPKSQRAKDYLGIFDTIQNEDGSIQL